MFEINLSGKNAIVTGGGQGLAKATAILLAECGANVLIGDIREDLAMQTAEELRARGVKSDACKVDISNLSEIEQMFKAAESLGNLDIVINAAGIPYPKALELSVPSEIERLVQINLLGTDNCCRLAYRAMKDRGGRVVNFSSTAGRAASDSMPHYAMTKAAIINLTQSYALAGAAHKVCFNAVCPGIIRTDMWEKTLDAWTKPDGRENLFHEAVRVTTPTGLPQDAIDIANAVVFLSSDRARYITGQTLNIDGGMHMN